MFAFDADAPGYLVKSVFQTAAFAGFPNARFAVMHDGRAGWLDVDAQVPGPPRSEGRLAPEVIQRVIRANFGALRRCYEKGLARDAAPNGRVIVTFVIDRDGHARGARDMGSTLGDAAAVQCMVGEFGKMVFPKPEGGIVTVTYPIMFNPG